MMKHFWRVRRLANAAGWSLIFFGVGVCGGILLLVMLPGMPWANALSVPTISDTDVVAALDLAAQRSMAAAAWYMAVVSSVSILIGAVSIWLLWANLREARTVTRHSAVSAAAALRSVEEARHSNQVARQIGRAQTRAYLAVSELLLVNKGFMLNCRFVLTNAGQSPARHVTIWLSVVTYTNRGRRRYRFPVVRLPAVARDVSTGLEVETNFETPSIDDFVTFVVNVEIQYTDVFGSTEEDQFFVRTDRTRTPDLMAEVRTRQFAEFEGEF